MKLFWKIAKWTGIGLGSLILIAASGIGFLFARAAWWDHRPKVDCPILAYLHPIARTPISASDYLEVFIISAWGSEPTRIRIYGDGHVVRDTTFVIFNGEILGCPLHDVDKHLQIPSKDAVNLLTRARDGGFCRMCGRYRYPSFVYDAGSETVTLSLGGKAHSVENSAGTPPQLFEELIESTFRLSPMDELADTKTFTHERQEECVTFSQQQEALHPNR